VEAKMLTLMAQISFLAVLVWVLAAAFGKRGDLKVASHPTDRKLDPKSNVWNHSGVSAPLATPTLMQSGVAIR
jgi:hypothetical protein